jgi:hypothetical protein
MPSGYAATTGVESIFQDMYSAELFDLRVSEASLVAPSELGLQKPTNIVRADEQYRLLVRIRFTGPLHFGIVPNRIKAKFFLEGVGLAAPEIDIPEVVIVSSLTEVALVTPPFPVSGGAAGSPSSLLANHVYKVAAAVEVENPANGSTRMSGFIEGATLHVRETAIPGAAGEPIPF